MSDEAKPRKIYLSCPCGERIEATSEDEMVELANAHLEADHPTMAGTYSREQILAMTW